MNSPGLVAALSAIIKGAVSEKAAGPILAAAPAPALAQALASTRNISPEIVQIVTSILSQKNQANQNVAAALGKLPGPPEVAAPPANNSRPANAIGNAYYAGRRLGYVFGKATEPMFKRKGQTEFNSSYKGWVLEPRPAPGNVPRFEFVMKSYTGFGGGGNVEQAIRQNAPPNVAAGLLAIIAGATVNSRAPVSSIKNLVSSVITGSVKGLPEAQRQTFLALPPTQKQEALTQPGRFPSFKFPNWLSGFKFPTGFKFPWGAPAAPAAPAVNGQAKKQANVVNGRIQISVWNRVMGRTKKPVSGNGNAAATPAKPVNGNAAKPVNGSAVTVKPVKKTSFFNWFKGLFPPARKVVDLTKEIQNGNGSKRKLEELEKAIKILRVSMVNARQVTLVNQIIQHYYPPSVMNGTKPVPNAEVVERELKSTIGSGNYSKTNLANMVSKRGQKNGPTNSDISERLEQELEKLKSLSDTARLRRLGELLKIIPEGMKGRGLISTMILEEIRRAGQNANPNVARRRLADLKSDLKLGFKNRELLAALNVENSRARNNVRQNEGVGKRRGETQKEYISRLSNTKRRSYETNDDYNRRVRRTRRYEGEGANNYTRRMETYSRRRNEPMNNYNRRVSLQNRRLQAEQEEINRRRRARAEAPPPLPANQNTAIRNAGGIPTAMNTVASVPGGAPEIAKAAEALNETGGNAVLAVNVKGASPVAVQAVQRLGGPTNAVNVLEGLNTLAQTTATRKRKAARAIARPRKRGPGRRLLKPRLAELNRVINSVKKKRLISLVAHNVTKTDNIHEDENRLKSYYKKVIKANILRTPLAAIVRKSKAKAKK